MTKIKIGGYMEKIQWAPPPEHKSTDIKWICTPKSCAECDHYNQKQKRCGVKECPYPARRGTGGENG